MGPGSPRRRGQVLWEGSQGAGLDGRGVARSLGQGQVEGAGPGVRGGARGRDGARQKGRAQLRAGPGSWLPAGRAGAWRPSREPPPGRRTCGLGAEPRQVRHGSGRGGTGCDRVSRAGRSPRGRGPLRRAGGGRSAPARARPGGATARGSARVRGCAGCTLEA